MRRRLKKPNPKKLRVKNIAAKLFARYGFEGISITDIAEKADVSVSMISYYFGGKTELYDSIIEDLFKQQNDFLNDLIPIAEFHELHVDKKIAVFTEVMCKIVNLFYQNISSDVIMIILREQQNQNVEIIKKSPGALYLRELIADILEQNLDSKSVIYCTLSIISLMSAPRLLTGFSLGLLHQDDFKSEDVELIKNNIKVCVPDLLKAYSKEMSIINKT